MKKSYFNEEQLMGAVLKEAGAGVSVKELCRRIGISDHAFYPWGASAEGRKRMRRGDFANPNTRTDG